MESIPPSSNRDSALRVHVKYVVQPSDKLSCAFQHRLSSQCFICFVVGAYPLFLKALLLNLFSVPRRYCILRHKCHIGTPHLLCTKWKQRITPIHAESLMAYVSTWLRKIALKIFFDFHRFILAVFIDCVGLLCLVSFRKRRIHGRREWNASGFQKVVIFIGRLNCVPYGLKHFYVLILSLF